MRSCVRRPIAASSRTYELNLKASRSEHYAYDGLQRLVSMKRGELNAERSNVPSPTRSQTWTLDALGNSRSVTSSSAGTSVTETREHNAANEITWRETVADPIQPSLASTSGSPGDSSARVLGDSHAPTLRQALLALLPWYRQQSGRNLSFNAFVRLLKVDPATLDTPPGGGPAASGSGGDPAAGATSAGTSTTTPVESLGFYDAAGNLVVDPQASSTTYVYDAWNRMVKVSSAGATIASYAYDGRGFRVAAEVDDVTTHDYFNDSWQVIEQRVGSSTSARSQLVWSAAYVDALVQEKRDTDADGSLDRTLYATHDANFNVTAAVTPGGIAQQRFLYDAYGARSVLAVDWQPTTSPPILDHGHQGGRADAASGFVLFRHRYLGPNLMRWTSRDPAGYVDGGSLYLAFANSPISVLDPTGMEAIELWYDTAPDADPKAVQWWQYTHATPSELIDDLNRQCDTDCVQTLVIAGHGSPGTITLGGVYGRNPSGFEITAEQMQNINRGSAQHEPNLKPFLEAIARALCSTATLEFGTCKSGQGKRGDLLAKELSDFFRRRGKYVTIRMYSCDVKTKPWGIVPADGSKPGGYKPLIDSSELSGA